MQNSPTTSTSSQNSLPSLAVLQTLQKQLMAEQDRRKRRNAIAGYIPYPKQREFHARGAASRERLLMAGNQLGKTYCGGSEASYHLTGQYPEWWTGKRFAVPIRMWCGSVTSEMTRDSVQRTLIGKPADSESWGEGTIPADCLGKMSRRQGVSNALDTVLVRHVSGGWSSVGFKSYDQGREKWQSESLHVVWFDEEPPMDIYMEGLTRTNAVVGSMVYTTFTPLMGMSDVVHMFLEGDS